MSSVQPETIPTSEVEGPTFRLFPKLPIELRLMIWKLDANRPQLVQITADENMHNEEEPFQRDSVMFANIFPLGGPCKENQKHVPSILHTNHEARTEGLKYYTKAKPSRAGNSRYFNYNIDVFYFGHIYWFWEITDAWSWFRPSACGILRNAQTIIINEDIRDASEAHMCRYEYVALFDKLKTVIWIDKDVFYLTTPHFATRDFWINWSSGTAYKEDPISEMVWKQREAELVNAPYGDDQKWKDELEGKQGIVRVRCMDNEDASEYIGLDTKVEK